MASACELLAMHLFNRDGNSNKNWRFLSKVDTPESFSICSRLSCSDELTLSVPLEMAFMVCDSRLISSSMFSTLRFICRMVSVAEMTLL